jgi:hypothetical protein
MVISVNSLIEKEMEIFVNTKIIKRGGIFSHLFYFTKISNVIKSPDL